MLLQTALFSCTFGFFLFDLFSYFMNCKNILFYIAKVQEKIANHAECGCANLIDKVLEVNALNDFFTLFTNFNVQHCTMVSFDYLPALILQFSCKLVLMLFNTTLMRQQNWNKKNLRELLEVVVKSCDH